MEDKVEGESSGTKNSFEKKKEEHSDEKIAKKE